MHSTGNVARRVENVASLIRLTDCWQCCLEATTGCVWTCHKEVRKEAVHVIHVQIIPQQMFFDMERTKGWQRKACNSAVSPVELSLSPSPVMRSLHAALPLTVPLSGQNTSWFCNRGASSILASLAAETNTRTGWLLTLASFLVVAKTSITCECSVHHVRDRQMSTRSWPDGCEQRR